jgi:hypothetical protein
VCTELLNPDAGSDEEYEYAADDKCVCGHRAHSLNFVPGDAPCCPDTGCGNCVMKSCWSCDQPAPKWLLCCHSGCCGHGCAILTEVWCNDYVGPVVKQEIKTECPICMEKKHLYQLQACGHAFCRRCLLKTTHTQASNKCSMCRTPNESVLPIKKNYLYDFSECQER